MPCLAIKALSVRRYVTLHGNTQFSIACISKMSLVSYSFGYIAYKMRSLMKYSS